MTGRPRGDQNWEDEPERDEEEVLIVQEGKGRTPGGGEERRGRRKTAVARGEAQHPILLACPELNLCPLLSTNLFLSQDLYPPSLLGH